MQENISPFQIYKQSLAEFLLKIVKLIPKNKKEIKTEADKTQDLLKTLNEQRFINANGHINFFRDLLDLKITKVTELALFYLEKFIANDLIDGHSDYSSSKTFVDEILQMVIECIGIKEDSIHLLVVRTLHTIVMTPSCTVYGGNLVYLAQALINVYSQNNNSKSIPLQNVTLLALKNIVKKVFQRMEKFTEITSEQQEIFCFKRCITSNRVGELLFQEYSFSSCNLAQQDSKSSQGSPRNSSQSLTSELQTRQSSQSLTKQQLDFLEGDQIDPAQILNLHMHHEERPYNFSESDIKNQIEDYCQQAVTNLVDNTVIYYEKRKSVQDNQQIEFIPKQCVPPFNKEASPEYIKVISVKTLNELNQVSGKFGWCFVCRKTAEYYCKHTRVAVCSPECKKAHLKQIEDIEYLQSNKKRAVKKNQYLEDGIELFKILCQLSKRDGANLNSQINPQSLKSKIISLEMLKIIMENTSMVFLSNFQSLIKDQLIHSVLLNSMSQDQRVVQLSLHILVHLFIDFRDNLKKEIEMFVKDILLKMLESSNTIYYHRFLVLQVFNSIFKTPRVILELFVNYDCQLNSKNITQNIIELLARIAQGKYSKPEFSSLFQPGQEHTLRETALHSLVEIVKYLIPFTVLSEDYFSSASQGGKQGAEGGQTAASSERQLDKEGGISRSVSNLEEEESKTQHYGIQNELNIVQSPSKNGSSQNLNLSQFNSTGGGNGISDSSLSQDLTEDVVQEQRRRKIIIQKCIEKFNYKTKLGLKFAFDENIIDKPLDINKKPSENESEEEALAIWQRSVYQLAELLYQQKGSLDRPQIGLFFGDESKYNQDVFYLFISNFNLKNLNIVQSLRQLFKIIYPPGTSEAVDRILQQFGEKFTKDNPNLYKNAGVAYTLSYAIMMLQTNLYNPQIKEKEKMNLQSFQKLVSKINDGEDLPLEHVESIFNNVKEEPLGIHDQEDYQNKIKEAINSDSVLKTKKFKEEQEKMLAQGKQMIQSDNNDEDSQKFIRVLTPNFTRELLDVIWSPLFATFSQGLEQSEEKKFILTCLEGFKYCIMLLGRYQLSFQQETFVQCLTKNTALLSDKPFSIKNILSTCCMIEIVSQSGNQLRGSWKSVLDCLSRIDYYVSGDFINREYSSQQNMAYQMEIDKSNQKLLQISFESEAIDKIFSSTAKFESEAIQDFIDCLCQTSSQEVSLPKPRTFSLQRISEVAEFNMDRVRFEWNKIWQTLSQLFQEVGTNSNSHCAQLVIDLLKQLSMKFLKKTELSHYSFQKMFLQPFLYIFEKNDDSKYEIFELILSCIKMITSINFDNLRSGWNVIIKLVKLTIEKKIDSLIVICSQIIDQIFQKDRTLENLSEEIPEIGDILYKLINYHDQQISSNCISYLNKLIDYLVLHSKFVQNQFSQQINQKDVKSDVIIQIEMKQQRAFEYEKMLQQLWIPSLNCLSKMFGDKRLQIQRKSIEVLFKLVESYSYMFQEEFWEVLFTELFIPYFEQMSTHLAEKNNSVQYINHHMKDSCQISYDSLIEIFSLNFTKMQGCLKHILFILEKSITSFQEIISKIAAEQMQSLLVNIGQYLSVEQLDQVLAFLEIIFESSLPKDLTEAYQGNEYLRMTFEDVIVNKKINDLSKVLVNLDLNYKRILSQVVIQLISINCCKEYFAKYSVKFTLEQLERTKKYLYNSYQFATEFNSMIVFRYTLFKNGFLSDSAFPHLLVQQRDSRSVLLLIWFENYIREVQENKKTGTNNKAYLKLFLDNTITSISKFVEYSRSVSDSQEYQAKLQFDLYQKKSGDDNIQSFEKIIRNQYILEKNKYILFLRNNISQIILPSLKLIQPSEYYDNIHQMLNSLIDLSSYSFQRNLLTITCSSCQKCEMCKSQSVDSFDIDLKIIIKNLISFMTQFLPPTLPLQYSQHVSPIAQVEEEIITDKQEQQQTHEVKEEKHTKKQRRSSIKSPSRIDQSYQIKVLEPQKSKENDDILSDESLESEDEKENKINNQQQENNDNHLSEQLNEPTVQKEEQIQLESVNNQIQERHNFNGDDSSSEEQIKFDDDEDVEVINAKGKKRQSQEKTEVNEVTPEGNDQTINNDEQNDNAV